MRPGIVRTALLATVLAVGLVGTVAVNPLMAQESLTRVLTVTGRGSEGTPATIAAVDLGIEVQGENATAVQQEVARRTSAVLKLVQARQVQKLQTTGVRLNPQYNYDGNEPRITGYVGANTISFRMPTEQVGALLDDAIAAGANQINNVSFVAADDAIATARQTALREATADAQAQANAVLQALNLSPTEIVGIQVDGANSPVPLPYAVSPTAQRVQAADSTQVVGGEQTIEASVTLQIRY